LNEKLGKHLEAAYWHPWNLAWFKTESAILLDPEIKKMRWVVPEIQPFPTS
jgi:hypothetical protein